VRELVVLGERERDAYDRDMKLARMTALLMRQRRIPDEARLLARRIRGRQTVREQRMVLAELSEQFGIPVRVRRVPGSRPNG
jgi:uncharacterized protein YceH (UPF0502 family)